MLDDRVVAPCNRAGATVQGECVFCGDGCLLGFSEAQYETISITAQGRIEHHLGVIIFGVNKKVTLRFDDKPDLSRNFFNE